MSLRPTRRDVLGAGLMLAGGLALPPGAVRAEAPALPVFVACEPLSAARLWERVRVHAVPAPRLVLVAEGMAPPGLPISCLSPRAIGCLGFEAARRLLPLPAHGLRLAAPAGSDEAGTIAFLAPLVASQEAAHHVFALALRDHDEADRLRARLRDLGAGRPLRLV